MRRSALLVLLFALPLGIGAFALFADGDDQRGGERERPPESAEAPVPETLTGEELIPPPVVRVSTSEATTTVLWPVRLDLELLEPRFLPKQEGVPPIGSGATARISGRLTGFDDNGVQAEVRFVAGANAGRVLRADPEGRFGAVDLYP